MSVCFAGVSDHPLSANGQRPGRRYFQWRPVRLHTTDRYTQHTKEHGKTHSEKHSNTLYVDTQLRPTCTPGTQSQKHDLKTTNLQYTHKHIQQTAIQSQ